jgi:ectoine hydroxylase
MTQPAISTGDFRARLSPGQIEAYGRDGFLRLPHFLAAAEIEPLSRACLADPEIDGALWALADSAGNPQEVTTWTELGEDYLGVLPRLARIVEAAEDLIGRPVYHWHSKLSMKKPGSAGRWDWHQDYGYWYDEGCLAPDMTTCMIAVDRTDRENGCVELIRGSHRLGRIDHKHLGAASGVDPERLAEILKTHERIACAMEPGDAVFFHANTLHASGANASARPRTLLHCSYNAVDNEPYLAEGQAHHKYLALAKLPDSALAAGAYRSIFSSQAFRLPDPAKGVTSYGYKVLKFAKRAPGRTPDGTC